MCKIYFQRSTIKRTVLIHQNLTHFFKSCRTFQLKLSFYITHAQAKSQGHYTEVWQPNHKVAATMNPPRISRYTTALPSNWTPRLLTIGPCITPIWAPPAFSSKPPAIWAAKFCEDKSQGRLSYLKWTSPCKNLSDVLQMQAMQSNTVDWSGIGPR